MSTDRPIGRNNRFRTNYCRQVEQILDTEDGKAICRRWQVSPLFVSKMLRTMITEWSNSSGKAIYPTQRRIAERLGYCRRHIARAINAAHELGALATQPRSHPQTDGPVRRTSSVYHFRLIAPVAPPPPVPTRTPAAPPVGEYRRSPRPKPPQRRQPAPRPNPPAPPQEDPGFTRADKATVARILRETRAKLKPG